ncbi:hypothetical protein D4764_01G0007630 [Takifugu flavidus]|uniref:HAT C-terminal dimerisation domain-containing protein n=1 Tax=Takifugu flavidus TaxID=433684 RepID=A0A5C6MI83_9TELE|nr:hypothetical protein D4764_0289940 [Takifugu flavidus]TWW80948.1 hypothetical protein D4764_01G0007630 [Takifugu flavidus]
MRCGGISPASARDKGEPPLLCPLAPPSSQVKPVSLSRKQKLDEALVDMIVKDGRPFSIVEGEGFQNFIKILDPSYSIPSRKAVKAKVEARYTVAKEKALAEIKQTSAVGLTADMWTSVNMDAYLGVTCYHVSDSLDLATVLLEDVPLETATTSASASEQNHNLWALLDNYVESQHRISSASASAAVEIQRYLKEQILTRAEDPLKYWVAQKTLNPTLWKLACKYLCIPASSVP